MNTSDVLWYFLWLLHHETSTTVEWKEMLLTDSPPYPPNTHFPSAPLLGSSGAGGLMKEDGRPGSAPLHPAGMQPYV